MLVLQTSSREKSDPFEIFKNMKLLQMLQILLIAFLSGFHIADAALSATVESGEEHCYNIIAPAGVQSTIHGNFDILDDNSSPDPIGVVLYDSKMVSYE